MVLPNLRRIFVQLLHLWIFCFQNRYDNCIIWDYDRDHGDVYQWYHFAGNFVSLRDTPQIMVGIIRQVADIITIETFIEYLFPKDTTALLLGSVIRLPVRLIGIEIVVSMFPTNRYDYDRPRSFSGEDGTFGRWHYFYLGLVSYTDTTVIILGPTAVTVVMYMVVIRSIMTLFPIQIQR